MDTINPRDKKRRLSWQAEKARMNLRRGEIIACKQMRKRYALKATRNSSEHPETLAVKEREDDVEQFGWGTPHFGHDVDWRGGKIERPNAIGKKVAEFYGDDGGRKQRRRFRTNIC
jgi:hypothetical protein